MMIMVIQYSHTANMLLTMFTVFIGVLGIQKILLTPAEIQLMILTYNGKKFHYLESL